MLRRRAGTRADRGHDGQGDIDLAAEHVVHLGGVVEENTMRTALEAAGFTEIEISNYSQYSFVVAVLITARRGSTS